MSQWRMILKKQCMRKQAKRVTVLYNVILKVARYRFCHLPFTESNPTDIEGTLQGCEYQGKELSVTHTRESGLLRNVTIWEARWIEMIRMNFRQGWTHWLQNLKPNFYYEILLANNVINQNVVYFTLLSKIMCYNNWKRSLLKW